MLFWKRRRFTGAQACDTLKDPRHTPRGSDPRPNPTDDLPNIIRRSFHRRPYVHEGILWRSSIHHGCPTLSPASGAR
jgi:hypothetical protein